MSEGIDVNQNCTDHLDCIVSAGKKFVVRYYRKTVATSLSKQEAKAITQAGLYTVVIFESGHPDHNAYFTHAQGVTDGTLAYNQAQNRVGQPAGTPIYFAVDYGPTDEAVTGPISQYFLGIYHAFQNAGNDYRIGVYGSANTCKHLHQHTDFVKFTWLAYPYDGDQGEFNGTSEFQDWNILQTRINQNFCEMDVDLDRTHGIGGGFQIF